MFLHRRSSIRVCPELHCVIVTTNKVKSCIAFHFALMEIPLLSAASKSKTNYTNINDHSSKIIMVNFVCKLTHYTNSSKSAHSRHFPITYMVGDPLSSLHRYQRTRHCSLAVKYRELLLSYEQLSN